ncbi:MAG TPA: peptidoglycan DD-metalloendopeptidase family protein [Dongiaceae bacterium]|nr:peptidoglycan DD-metalloendopeptidase family protein [Dongiaceae bacterium]
MLPLLLLLPRQGWAQSSQELENIEAALKASQSQSSKLSAAAAGLAKEISDLQTQLVARAAAARETETALGRLKTQLADLEQREAAQAVELASRRRALVQSLAALERLAMTPPGAALVSAAPLDLARGQMLLALAVPELQRRSQSLEADIAGLRELSAEIASRRSRMTALAASLDAGQREIASLLVEKAELQRQTAAEAAAADARSAKLAAEAKDLKDLLDRIAAEQAAQQKAAKERAAQEESAKEGAAQEQAAQDHAGLQGAGEAPTAASPPSSAPASAQAAPPPQTAALPQPPANARTFPTKPGSLVTPVAGPIIGRFDQLAASGSKEKGILIQAQPGATVLAPFDGLVVYRGPFRSYGEILIIQHSGGYHSVLAGLGRSDAAVGQWVLAGEPVGMMGSPQDGNTRLYVELRRDGHPIDPAPWLGKTDTNVEEKK